MFKIDRMQVGHLQQVAAIEAASYPAPWSYNSFLYELTENDLGRYIVALQDDEVIGYAGMWIVLDEAHIVNIAVAETWRGRRVAEILLRQLMLIALMSGATDATLEVRPSNHSALKLYQRLGFEQYGRRKNYYVDNEVKEDALIMWKNLLFDPGLAEAEDEILNIAGEENCK